MQSSKEPSMYVPQMDAVLNRWFTSYKEARVSLEEQGGFLLSYKGQYFITEEEGIRELGLDPSDPNWARIERDWVQPRDREAWNTLKEQRKSIMFSRGG